MSKLNRLLLLIFAIFFLVISVEICVLFYFFFTNNNLPACIEPETKEGQDFYKDLKSGIITSSVVNTEYKGKIINLDIKGGTIPDVNVKYKIGLDIAKDKGRYRFRFLEKTLDKVTVVKLVNNEEVPMDFDDLKINDEVVVKSTFTFVEGSQGNFVHHIINVKVIKI